MQSTFSDHSGIKQEINTRNTTEKSANIWKLNTLLSNPWIKDEISKEILKTQRGEWKWKYNISKFVGCS